MAANYPTSAEENDLYEAIKCDVLIDLRDWLVGKLATDKIVLYLRSKRVLDQNDEEIIRAGITTTQKNSKLLDILETRGSRGFDQFCHAIRERCTGQEYVLDKILIEFDRKKEERIPKDLLPPNFHGGISSPSEDPKLVVMVTGVPGPNQVDLNNLPGPGDPGAPVPPDETESSSDQAHPDNPSPNIPPPSYTPESPPPYSE